MPVQRKSVRNVSSPLVAGTLPAGAIAPIPHDQITPVPDLSPQDIAGALADIGVTMPLDTTTPSNVCTLTVRTPYNATIGALEFTGVPSVSAVLPTVAFPGYNDPVFGQNIETLGIWLHGGRLYVIDVLLQSKRAGTWFHLQMPGAAEESIEATGALQHIIRGYDARQSATGTYGRLTLCHNGRKRLVTGEPKPFVFHHCYISSLA